MKISIDHLPVFGLEDTVHGLADTDEPIPDPDPDHEFPAGNSLLDDPAGIAYHLCLEQLADHVVPPVPEFCKYCGNEDTFGVKVKSRGTAAIIEWVSDQF